MIDYCDKLTGVFGHPVSENPGVIIMDAAYASIGAKNWRFLTIDVDRRDLGGAIGSIRILGMRGINLTIPHKVEAMKYLDEITEEAGLIGAVNTIVNENGKLIGYNTDGTGFLMSLADDGINPAGKRFVMLGTGGAARAIGTELCLAGAAELLLIGIDMKQAEELSGRLGKISECKVSCVMCEAGMRIPSGTDVLVNATPIGLYPDVKKCPDIDYASIPLSTFVQDVIPNPITTEFIKRVRAQGNRYGTGMTMMINQAAINTKLWTGIMPDKEAMTKAYEVEID